MLNFVSTVAKRSLSWFPLDPFKEYSGAPAFLKKIGVESAPISQLLLDLKLSSLTQSASSMMAIFSFKRGSPRDGGLAGIGVGGMYAWRVGEADRAGHYDVKFGGQAVADESKRGFESGRKDEEDIGISFLNCNIASLIPRSLLLRKDGMRI